MIANATSMFTSVTRPCTACQQEYEHTFMGSCCPSCNQPNWKYQGIVMPVAFFALGAVLAAAICFTLGRI
jgi:hypothetical protein